MAERPVWLIGCGNMAGAMLRGWLAAGEAPGRFAVIDPGEPELPDGIARAVAPPGDGFGNAIVQLGFKPYLLADVAAEIGPAVGPDTIVVSILAGVELESLRGAFPSAGAIVRVMPNMPVAIGKGAVGVIAEDRGDDTAQTVERLLEPLGTVEWVGDERLLHVLTALVGSGPAFVYRYIDALAKAAVAQGVDPATARDLAIATAEGAAALAASSSENPAQLAERVASPGGTTRKGLDVLDAENALAKLVEATLAAATQRAQEMAEEAKS